MLIELLISAFGAYIGTSGIRSDVKDLNQQALANYYKAEQTRATIVQMNKELNGRIDVLEGQHAAIYKMTEWVAILQIMQMKGGKYIGNDLYRVIEKKDTIIVDLTRRVISERYRGLVYHRDYNTNNEYINGVLVHEYRNNMELVYNLEGQRMYLKEPYNNTWRETWYYPDGQVQQWKVDNITKCFDEEGNATCWLSGTEDLLALEREKAERERKHQEEIAPRLAEWRECVKQYPLWECIPKCKEEMGFFEKLSPFTPDCTDKCTAIKYSKCGSKPI